MARGVQTMRTVPSNDGTQIAFERIGDGPPDVDSETLATELARFFGR